MFHITFFFPGDSTLAMIMLMTSMVRCYHLHCDCCTLGRLLLGYEEEVCLLLVPYHFFPLCRVSHHVVRFYRFEGVTSWHCQSALSNTLDHWPLANYQDSPRQTDDPNHDRYLQTPHFSLRRRHNRINSPNSLVSILRNHSSRYLRYLDARFRSLYINSILRVMFIWESRWTYFLRYFRLLLGFTGHRQCGTHHIEWRSIWRMVLFRTKESSWWCSQGSYFQGIR